ncbi:galactose-binding domain-like protein [Lentinula boryana]|uniref:Galactose-binding domain-like protein n=1 Tax=Lentinula boryana TaxID=40481 RepID=A0ABQ8QST3_9AGAR|nr:galactose-binding domain-like protein [Lentinula boryana]
MQGARGISICSLPELHGRSRHVIDREYLLSQPPLAMSFEQIQLSESGNTFSGLTELSSVALGGRVLSVSDEFFAEAFHLLLVESAPSLKGQFGPNGALYSGWETRRHNPTYDWCIIKLGASGRIFGFDIDTTNFNGNEAPEASIEAFFDPLSNAPESTDIRWTEILPKVKLGPSSRHLFTIPNAPSATFVKLNMFPDGGIARFRVYGHVQAVMPEEPTELFDLAHVFAGGRVEFVSDQHFGIGSNLILPGRGTNMGDGWETKRSRLPGHKDWVIIRLAAPGFLEQVELDTAHFKGNFPESCEIHALASMSDMKWTVERSESENWTLILPRTKLGPHRQHYFQLENVEGTPFTHIKLTIHPDGGLKRVRIIGRRADVGTAGALAVQVASVLREPDSLPVNKSSIKPVFETTIPVLPLTPEAFMPFGQVIQAYNDHTAVPKGTMITPANAGTANKFHKLALLAATYPDNSGATTGLSVYRCQPLKDVNENDRTTALAALERHPFTNQAFIPMGSGRGEGLVESGHRYLVVVAKNGEDDRPDLKTLRAFVASAAQGIVYDTGIWHQPMTVLDKALDFTCVETQIGNGGKEDCEVVQLENSICLRLP